MSAKTEAGSVGIRGQDDETIYTDIPDWITWAVRPMARELYRIMRMHVNRRRPNKRVWPTKLSLAALMGFEREESLDPYIKELISAGCIEKTQEGMPRRNVYTVLRDPPAAYAGPLALDDWYDERKVAGAAEAERRPRRGAKARATRPDPQAPDQQGLLVPGSTRVQGGEPAVPAPSRVHEPGYSRVKPKELKPKELKPPPPTPSGSPPGGTAKNGPEEEGPPTDEERTTATAVLDAAQTLGEAPPALRVNSGERFHELVVMAVAALRSGWRPDDLVAAIGGELLTAKSVFGALRYRLQPAYLGAPPAAPPSAPPTQRQPCPRHCVNGLIAVGDKGLHCPHCRPDAHARQLAETRGRGCPVGTFDDLVAAARGDLEASGTSAA